VHEHATESATTRGACGHAFGFGQLPRSGRLRVARPTRGMMCPARQRACIGTRDRSRSTGQTARRACSATQFCGDGTATRSPGEHVLDIAPALSLHRGEGASCVRLLVMQSVFLRSPRARPCRRGVSSGPTRGTLVHRRPHAGLGETAAVTHGGWTRFVSKRQRARCAERLHSTAAVASRRFRRPDTGPLPYPERRSDAPQGAAAGLLRHGPDRAATTNRRVAMNLL